MPILLPDEVLREAVALRNAHPTLRAAADAAGVSWSALNNRLRRAADRGLDGSVPRPLPPGQIVRGTSILYGLNQSGEWEEKLQWVKTREDPAVEDVVAYLKGAFDDVAPAAPAPVPGELKTDLLTLLPCGDWHLGMFSWGRETGTNWDLKIAESTIGQAVEDTLERSPRSVHAIILSGGDLLHADNSSNQTSKSGNQLDVDGRYDKVVHTAARLMVRTVDSALRRHGHVTVRILKGNHDRHSSVAIAYFLLAYYRNDLRVTVDVDPSLFFWFRFGQVLLGATHGDEVKITQMPGIMAHRRAEEWGQTKFRYVHGFHLHHSAKFATEGGGVISEIHQTPIPQDAWHFGAGFISGRSVQAITYHRDYGDIGRVRTAILDGTA